MSLTIIDMNGKKSIEIELPLRSVADLPAAYDAAIQKAAIICYTEEPSEYYEPDPEFWNGTITLKTIKFEKNYKREKYVAVFEVTEG